MNNTKWREIFGIICDRKILFQIGINPKSDWDYATNWSLDKKLIAESHIMDPGLGGPFFYHKINSVKVLKSIKLKDRYGEMTISQNIISLAADIGRIGLIPLAINDDYIEILSA
jgi:hypothetical protein